MEQNLQELQQRLVNQLKPGYQSSLKRSKDALITYTKTYEEAVDLIAKALKVSKEKTRFASRDLLQQVMNEITR